MDGDGAGIVLLVGGARSGKSTMALSLAERSGRPVVFVATGEATDAEMATRIARHRAERPSGWQTIEAPLDLVAALDSVPPDSCVVIDCLTLWVSNRMARGEGEEAILAATDDLVRAALGRPQRVIVVSNEVGSGIVPMEALSRAYRDTLGRVNAAVAAAARAAYLVVAGRAVALGPPPDVEPGP